MWGRSTIQVIVSASLLCLGACAPDFLSDDVKAFSDAATAGSAAANAALSVSDKNVQSLKNDVASNLATKLQFNAHACAANPTAINCGITTGKGQSLLIVGDTSNLATAYFTMMGAYATNLAALLAANTTTDIDSVEKALSSDLTGLQSLKVGLPAGLVALPPVLSATADGIGDTVRLAKMRENILRAQSAVQQATAVVTQPQFTGDPSIMQEFRTNILSGLASDIDFLKNMYNQIPPSEAYITNRRLVLDAIITDEATISAMAVVDLQKLATSMLAAHEQLVTVAKQGPTTLKGLGTALQAFGQQADAFYQAVAKLPGI